MQKYSNRAVNLCTSCANTICIYVNYTVVFLDARCVKNNEIRGNLIRWLNVIYHKWVFSQVQFC